MNAPFYTTGPFIFDRNRPPLFCSGTETNIADFLVTHSREFCKLGTCPEASHNSVMNCGITLGEYSILKSMDMNRKRMKKHHIDSTPTKL